MKLRNKVLKRPKLLMLMVVILLAGGWTLLLNDWLPYYERVYWILLPIITVWAVIFIIPVFFTHIFSKGFDTYYETLLPLEQQQFEAELANAKPSQKIIMTSKAIVHIDFIVIKAYSYESIRTMQKAGRVLILNGENGVIGAVREMPGCTVEQLMQEIWKRNPSVQQVY